MTMTPPQLTDLTALSRHRSRSQRAPADFLRIAIADEVEERLNEVNRTFTKPAVITPYRDIWEARLPALTLVEDREVLQFDHKPHDLIIHDLTLHWANDPVGQLVQCRHALEPDGLLIATLFGGETLHELRTSLAEAESRVTGGLSPRVAPMGEVRDLGALLQRAGFALPVADVTPFHVVYRSLRHLMHDLRAMGETNALAGRHKRATRRAIFDLAEEVYANAFGKDGLFPATFEIITLTGWSPSDTQPKPLRPGSAKTRLADALGTQESPLDWSDR